MQIPEATEQKCDVLRYPDLEVQDEGTIVLLHPRTDSGAQFIGDNLPDHGEEGPMFFGKALVIEHSYAQIWIDGAIEAGLRVV